MKTLLQPFFGRSASSQGHTPKKISGWRQDTLVDDRGRPDKTAPSAELHRDTVRPPASHPHNNHNQNSHQTPVGGNATSSPHTENDSGLLSRLIRRRTSHRGPEGHKTASVVADDLSGSRESGKNLTGAPPPSSWARGRGTATQLPTVVDEGCEESTGTYDSVSSCSHVAPPSAGNGQNMDAAAKKSHRGPRMSRPHKISSPPESVNNMVGAATPRSQPSTKVRPKSSFRDRFWTASSSNDFGEGKDVPELNDQAKTPAADADADATTTPPKPAAYVPRHAASDFSRTTMSSYHHHHHRHRHSTSWDGSKSSVRSPVQRTPHPAPASPPVASPLGNNYTHEPVSATKETEAGTEAENEEEDPFADSHETATLDDTASRRPQRLSAPPALDRTSVAELVEDWPPSDYERFLARAAAEERAQRVQAARRSWREGSRRDSAYYSGGGGKKGSERTSEDGSGFATSASGSAPPPTPRLPEWTVDAKRQSRVAQKIVEYIRPPREDPRMPAMKKA